MEKHHKTVGEFEFPEEIIHQIQCFMGERKAAGTILVSKSWYGAWSTRPNLSFDQYEWGKKFRQYATKTLQRYEYLNLNIQTFSLRIYDDVSLLARELILKAIKLGAVDLTIQVLNPSLMFVLPYQVLESQTLATLSVEFVKLDLERMINKPLITSSNLKSLTLQYCTLTKGDFSYLSRRFPLLEELTLELVRLNTQDSLSKSELWLQFPCLKTLVIRHCYFKAKLKFDVPNIRKFKFEGYNDVPRLELKTSSREWESDIRITCWVYMGCASWLRSLKQFVKVLSPSRVSLALYLYYPQLGVEDGFVGDGLAIPAVEDLTIGGSRVSPAFLNALFWSCRPNFVNIQRRCVRGIDKEDVEQFQYLSSLPWNTLLDDSTNHSEEFIRFQLK